MPYLTPLDAIKTLVEARDKGDVETVVSCYEANATIVPQPGTVQHGTKALREWLASFAAVRPKLNVTSREIIEGGDIALHCSAWTMNGTDPTGKPFEMKGRTADVLRKQPNGSWLVALDNPWGTAILSQ
jgi:ketosteroid isomerase-like protein